MNPEGSCYREGSGSFLKKRTKKLWTLACGAGEPAATIQKFFASFFQKRSASYPS
jgi:hypothetical protein